MSEQSMNSTATQEPQFSREASIEGAAAFADAESREILNLLDDTNDDAAGSCCGGSCCA